MAVAVKNIPESATASPFDRLPVVSLLGVVYILGCFGVVCKLLPSFLLPALAGTGEKAAWVLLGLAMLLAGTALLILGVRLLGSHPPAGARAGIFSGLVGVLLVLLLTRWASMWIEHWVYRYYLFGENGPMVGAVLSAGIGLALLGVGIYVLFKKSTVKVLGAFEAQGWFAATSYKPLQGQRVRRGTILGCLLIAGAGIYTLLSHGTLTKVGRSWSLNIPFSGMVRVENPGDVAEHLAGLPTITGDDKVQYPYINRYKLREINDLWADPNKFVKLTDAGKSDKLRPLEETLVPRAEVQEEINKLQEAFDREHQVGNEETREAELKSFKETELPKFVAPEPAGGPATFEAVTLLPGLQFTVPLLLLVASLWLAWRVVNLPTFADFLIATEAELNKVSWTTRKRLFQDTVVVLSTVLLMAGFLFVMDQSWRVILSWKPIGVLQFPEDQAEQNKTVDEKPW